MVLYSDRMVQLLLPTSWLSQARDWYVQFQLRLAIDPISLVTQSCILLTALAAGGYVLHLRGWRRNERRSLTRMSSSPSETESYPTEKTLGRHLAEQVI